MSYSDLCGQLSQLLLVESLLVEALSELSLDPDVASVDELPPRWSVL